MKVKYDDSDLNLALENIEQLEDNYVMLSNEAVNFFKDCFNEQGFTDHVFVPWKKSLKDNGATLVLSGNLRNSVVASNITSNGFTIQSDTPYSEIHNNGGRIRVTDKMRRYFYIQGVQTKNKMWFLMMKKDYITIPQRKFIGESEVLYNKLLTFILRYF